MDNSRRKAMWVWPPNRFSILLMEVGKGKEVWILTLRNGKMLIQAPLDITIYHKYRNCMLLIHSWQKSMVGTKRGTVSLWAKVVAAWAVLVVYLQLQRSVTLFHYVHQPMLTSLPLLTLVGWCKTLEVSIVEVGESWLVLVKVELSFVISPQWLLLTQAKGD